MKRPGRCSHISVTMAALGLAGAMLMGWPQPVVAAQVIDGQYVAQCPASIGLPKRFSGIFRVTQATARLYAGELQNSLGQKAVLQMTIEGRNVGLWINWGFAHSRFDGEFVASNHIRGVDTNGCIIDAGLSEMPSG